jgi:hypothetical protein
MQFQTAAVGDKVCFSLKTIQCDSMITDALLTLFIGQIPEVTLTYVPYDAHADPNACGR